MHMSQPTFGIQLNQQASRSMAQVYFVRDSSSGLKGTILTATLDSQVSIVYGEPDFARPFCP